ncbi:DUF423-domain-containing protein [Dacryopinax primogenitus]|uniref:DUF423-domain-containing protein n=1 Tax=Dacryopinax primogenitus (strain DJM 731) TaxID=1858805 RepID=M5G973_DACPD|nr:DUF423-domain-containing protein [Dacryopinax primogenitus]EJU05309.1 DUF423-domain-containing protein [Dacryopinax primogenitus]
MPFLPPLPLQAIAGLSGAAACIAGAFGTHTLRAHLPPASLEAWQTAAHYQLIHSLALLYVSTLPPAAALVPGYLFTAGIGLFSGTIYGLTGLPKGHTGRKVLGPLTPLGGSFLIAGWVVLAFTKGKVRLGR